ncbi:6-phosphofructokinase [Lagierella sp.]|uniref:6-phosphofructokinase n=1 Tax=Lagierella sp. TaxID=2849657 RepID=UPI002604B2B9|nr:6-phosphofructokinase [Lagierella sp.]
MKTIAVLTSGGDAPGMNAAIRAVTRTSIFNGLRIMGIRFGFDGLINGNIYEMNVSSVADIIQRGGTILGSARSEEFQTERGQNQAVQILKDFGIDGLVILGGDGSFKGAQALSEKGIKTIGIPCTIDNDMGYTDSTVGFYTAVNTVTEAISKLRDTSSSHGRANIVEVMGRHCGDIALYSGVASGAESIIIPEKPLDLESIMNKIKRGRKRGKLHHIIVIAEGVGRPYVLKNKIKEETNVDTKVTILGHVQRGGSPSPHDRLLATEMGNKAVKLLIDGQSGLAMTIKGGKIDSIPIKEAVEIPHVLNEELYEMAEEISI